MTDYAPPLPSPRTPRWHWVALLLILLVGSAIRLAFISHPPLWGDESLVYYRISGSYADLLQCLRDDGFVPLHYELAWALSQRFRPTPFMLRVVPALCGSFTIAAIYFLARELFDRRRALVAALLAATSAFGFFYSRDAKMYGELYLFSTLNLACLLWWLRTHRLTAWLGWIAAGCLAVGFHADGMIFPALSPLILLSSRKPKWRDGLWLGLGLVIIFLGPAGYYGDFNQWAQRIDRRGWNASGLQWVDWENNGRTGPTMVRSTLTSFFMGWTYPIPSVVAAVKPNILRCLQWAWIILLALLLLGVLPWPRQWRATTCQPTTRPFWRSLLWLGILIVPVGYIFYCHSMPDFAGPMGWLGWLGSWFPDVLTSFFSSQIVQTIALMLLAATITAAVAYRTQYPPAFRCLQVLLVIAAVVGLCELLFVILGPMATDALLDNRSWHSLWVPRYLGFLWPLLIVVAAALLMRLPSRELRTVAIVLFVGVNVVMIARRMFGDTEPPVNQMAADVVASQPAHSHVRAYISTRRGVPIPGGGDLNSNPGKYYLQILTWKQPMSPMRFQRSLYDYRLYQGYITQTIADEVNATPRLDDVITWESYAPGEIPNKDPLLPLLKGWKRISEKRYAVTSYWDWNPMSDYVRREYKRMQARNRRAHFSEAR